MLGKKLHPAAIPPSYPESRIEFGSLEELCREALFSSGYDRLFEVHPVPGSEIVQIRVRPGVEDRFEQSVIFVGDDEDFKRGWVSRSTIREACKDAVLKLGL